MTDDDTVPDEAVTEAPSAPAEAVPEAPAPAPEQPAAPVDLAPVEPAAEPAASPAAPAPTDLFDADMKAWFRANVRWVLIETQMLEAGRTEEERAKLNP